MGLLTIALVLDYWIGDPDSIWKRVPHPVVLIGGIISWWDGQRNNSQLVALTGADAEKSDFRLGVALVLMLLAGSLLTSWLVWQLGAFSLILSWVTELLIVMVLIAQKSLADHVGRVAEAFRSGGLVAAREAVSMIVGRDVSQLDESGVSRATVESLAENFSDGVTGPVFWYALAGLPGILFYKAVNTADSMIGHHSDNYEYFGKASARVDDWLNWPAARVSAVLIIVAASIQNRGKLPDLWNSTARDAGLHRSPNAGWPEAAVAASLNISLGGERRYAEGVVNASVLNASGREKLGAADIDEALSLYRQTCFVLLAVPVLLWGLQVLG